MANGNDPANIPYIIVENGFYYVAYKEKAKVPEVVVSAKGVANGLSEEYNDGWDFGPDSYDPNSTASIPYTQTTGINEAWNYSVSIGIPYTPPGLTPIANGLITPNIILQQGNYYIYNNNTLTANAIIFEPRIIGSGQAATWIHLRFNSGYAFTLDPNVLNGSNIDVFSHCTVILDSDYTATGLFTVTVPSSSSAYQNSVFNVYGLNVSSGNTVYSISGFAACIFDECQLYSTCIVEVSYTKRVQFIGGTNGDVGNTISINQCDVISFISMQGGTPTIQLMGTTESSTGIELTIIGTPFDGIQIGAVIDSILMINTQMRGTSASERISLISGQTSAIINKLIVINDVNNSSLSSLPYISSGITVGSIHTVFIDPTFTSVPYSTPSLTVNPPVSGTVYQNTHLYGIEIDLPVYATTAGTAGYVTVAKGATDTPTAIANQFVNGSTSSTSVDIIRLRVPAGWYYEFTASGVTFGTASVFAD